MTTECKPVEVSRRIEAPAARIFEILADPQRHVDFDGSDQAGRSQSVSQSATTAKSGRTCSLSDYRDLPSGAGRGAGHLSRERRGPVTGDP